MPSSNVRVARRGAQPRVGETRQTHASISARIIVSDIEVNMRGCGADGYGCRSKF